MKIPRILPIFIVLLLGLLLTSCTGGTITSNWPGLAADENTAYLASGPQVYAVRLNDAGLAWRYPEKADAKRSFYASPAITSDGQVIVPGFDSIVYSLNPQSGQMNWSYEEPTDRLIASPVISEDAIYVPSSDSRLYNLNLQGAKQWVFKTGHALWGPVKLDTEQVFFLSMDHFLYAVDKETGSQTWKTDLGASIVGAPAFSDDGMLYVGTVGKEMLALDAASGEIVWRVPVDGGVWASPVLHEESLYFGDLTGNFYAMDPANGAIRWKIQPDGPIVGSALIIENGVVFGTEAGTLHAFDFDGNLLWKNTTGGKLYTSPVLAGERILAAPMGAEDTLLIAYDLSGTQLWKFAPPE